MSVNIKPSRRVLHTSDLHVLSLDDHGCQALARVIDLAIREQVDLLLITGDLFDQNHIYDAVLDFVHRQFNRIAGPVIILPGNHDCLVEDSVYHRHHWQLKENVHIFRNNRGETFTLPQLAISIWGKPIDTYFDIRPLEGMPQPETNGNWNIATAHGLVVKHMPRHMRSYLITEDELNGTKWDYIALGHMTIFEHVWNNPVTYYCGSATEKGTLALVDLNETTGVKVSRCDIMKT